jgi:GNAT superfamily N-acetyltransferase
VPPPVRAAAAFGIAYRREAEEDRMFMQALYAATRGQELGLGGWPEELRRQFVAQQLFAQRRHLETVHPNAEWLIVERTGAPIGRLCIEDRGGDLWLVDIALMPESRGIGIGGAIMRDLLDLGREAGKPVSLTVFNDNPARRLYDRLGFVEIRAGDVYAEMVWKGEQPA